VYALTGKDSLPPPPPAPARILQPPPATASPAEVQRGKGIYHPYCSNCHGDAAVSGSFLPDLRYSALLQDPAAWQKVVHDGGLQHNGMVAFAAELSEADIEAVRAYVTRRAHDALAEQNSKE
jgi:alcohol dehydrogenase (cytochrome c)/quinohemoprotein ethanol dehydrogenase